MSDENDKKETTPTDPPKDSPADPPKDTPTPTDPPDPPAPPTPKPESEPVTRGEFNGIVEGLGKLTETVTALVDKLGDSNPLSKDSKPVSVPWTHRGSARRAE